MALFEADFAFEDRVELVLREFKNQVLDKAVRHFAKLTLRPHARALIKKRCTLILLLGCESHVWRELLHCRRGRDRDRLLEWLANDFDQLNDVDVFGQLLQD